MDLDRLKRLAGVTSNRVGFSRFDEATQQDIGFIKKFAKKIKVGDYVIRGVVDALNIIDPGWKLDITVGAMPMKEGPLTPKHNRQAEQDFMVAHGLSWVNLTGYSVSSASFSYSYGPKIGEYNVHASAKRTEAPSQQEIDKTSKAFLALLLDGVIQQKDPPNPVAGQVYVAPLGKPKVEEGPNPHFEGVNFTAVTFKLSAVRRGVEVSRLTSPKGEVIDLEGPSPSLWTRLYKTDIDKKAQAFIDSEGIAAKDAQKKAMKGYSENDSIGTCGICHNVQMLRKDELVLHGYKRPGFGWIQGSCFGVGYKAWEISPEAVEAYITHLDKIIPIQKSNIASIKSARSHDVVIDDHFLVKGSGRGHRKYTVTKTAFELSDPKKYSYNEVQKLHTMNAHPYALDAVNAAEVFGKTKDALVKNAEDNLKQMVSVKKECETAVANWKPQKLPGAGATLESSGVRARMEALLK